MRIKGVGVLGVVGAFLLLGVGCGGATVGTDTASPGSIAETTSTSTLPATTASPSTPSTSSTVASTTTTLMEAPAEYTVETLGYGPPSLVGSDGAGGSGCAPGTDQLPDGAWFGFVVDRSDVGIQFDLACWWSGDRANEVALEHGETEVPVPNDYYITNDSERLRPIEIAPDKRVAHLDYSGANTSEDPYVVMTFGDWGGLNDYLNCDFGSGNEFCLVWLFINDGVVTEMVEQYVP